LDRKFEERRMRVRAKTIRHAKEDRHAKVGRITIGNVKETCRHKDRKSMPEH
jgi:hypothetical protein